MKYHQINLTIIDKILVHDLITAPISSLNKIITGRSGSNSSGVQTTTLRSFSRWSICNSSKSAKAPLTNGKNLPRPYLTKYKAQRWVVTAPNTMSTTTWGLFKDSFLDFGNGCQDDISNSSLVELSEFTSELTDFLEVDLTESVI